MSECESDLSVLREAHLDAVRELYEQDAVNSSGGVDVNRVADRLDESYSQARYHLSVLAQEGFVRCTVGFPDDSGGRYRVGYVPCDK